MPPARHPPSTRAPRRERNEWRTPPWWHWLIGGRGIGHSRSAPLRRRRAARLYPCERLRAFATNANNPNVYVLAQIPAPNPGAPVPPPGQATDFKVELNSNGSITLKWKAKHPEGSDRVVYFVQRKLISETAFTLVGGSGEKSYQDDTLPIGIDGATYIVTAQRGNVQGQSSRQLTVTFGSGGPGAMRFGFAEANAVSKKAA